MSKGQLEPRRKGLARADLPFTASAVPQLLPALDGETPAYLSCYIHYMILGMVSNNIVSDIARWCEALFMSGSLLVNY